MLKFHNPYLHGLLEPGKCGAQSARLVKTIVGLKLLSINRHLLLLHDLQPFSMNPKACHMDTYKCKYKVNR